MRITTNNGTTISGSLSEVLATLSHLGVKAEAGEVIEPSTKPVTTVNVSGTMVTKADDVDKIAQSIIAKLHVGEAVTPVPVPKPARDSVIKMAIADVKDLLSRNYYDDAVEKFVGEMLWFVSDGGLYTVTDEVLFAVNADKRTVVASIRYNKNPKDVYKQGRAKCAPGDVFNEHIGKAIALRRALGLAVPVEYFEVEARDRDDLAVGDVVRGNIDKKYYDILKFIDRPPLEVYKGKIIRTKQYPHAGYLRGDEVTLVNDSARHTAPELEVSRIIRH